MPGIFGLFNNNQSDSDNCINLSAMAQSLSFAPEQEIEIFRHKWYSAGTVGYGESFSFLKKASAFKDDVLLIMDGEVFPDASDVPHEFAGNYPTIQRAEYCLYLYLKYGSQFVKQLNGIFVIAVFDNRDRTIHMFNDRFGFEPIYIWQNGNEFVFSTSQRSLLYYRDDIGLHYDKDAIAELIVFERILGDKTLFQDILRLLPASHAMWDGKQLKIEKYWTIFDAQKNEKVKNYKDVAIELHQLLKKSIFKRLSDNAKVGALISGGLDSRLLLALCPQSTIAVTFSNKDSQHSIETILAGKIAKVLGHKHFLIDREMDHYANVAELAVEVNESARTFAGCHSLGLHKQMMNLGINAVTTGYLWDTFFKGMYSTKVIENNIYSNEPYILQTRRISRQVADSLILRRQKHQDLMMLSLNKEMKERAAVVKERAIGLMQSLNSVGGLLGDFSERFILLDLQATAGNGFLRALRTSFPDRSPIYDNELLSFALSIPIEWKKDGQIIKRALKLDNPQLAWIKDANTGLPAGLCPPWNKIFETIRRSVRNTGKILSRYSKSINKLRQPAEGCKIFSQNSSWHDSNGLLRFSDKYRGMVTSSIERLDESVFDKNLVTELLEDELNAPAPRLFKLWEMILTFDLFDCKYGPSTDRNAILSKNENIKIISL